jgi:hypothetical protein
VIASLAPLDLPSLKLGQPGPAGTHRIASDSEFVRQLRRDLGAGGTVHGDRWAADYLIIETAP